MSLKSLFLIFTQIWNFGSSSKTSWFNWLLFSKKLVLNTPFSHFVLPIMTSGTSFSMYNSSSSLPHGFSDNLLSLNSSEKLLKTTKCNLRKNFNWIWFYSRRCVYQPKTFWVHFTKIRYRHNHTVFLCSHQNPSLWIISDLGLWP